MLPLPFICSHYHIAKKKELVKRKI